MNMQEKRVGHVVVLTVDGDITLGESGAARLAETVRRLVQRGEEQLVLDLGRVRYVDSAGLGELVQCAAIARNRGSVVKLVNVTKRLRDLLVVTKLLTVFDCFDREEEAVESFAAA
jgi:anti-sigma B factor antagonist